MTTRLIASIALLMLLTISGCFRTSETNQAPAPRPKEKTSAERILGKWKLIHDSSGLPDGFQVEMEFTADGAVTLSSNNPLELGPRIRKGTYRVEGTTLRYLEWDTDASPFPQRENWEPTHVIESLSEEKLTVVTTTRRRLTPGEAKTRAPRDPVKQQQLLAEVREEQSRTDFERVAEK